MKSACCILGLIAIAACSSNGPGPNGASLCEPSCPKTCGQDSDCNVVSGELCCNYGTLGKACQKASDCPVFCTTDSDCNTAAGEGCCLTLLGTAQKTCSTACLVTCTDDADCSGVDGGADCLTALDQPVCVFPDNYRSTCTSSTDCGKDSAVTIQRVDSDGGITCTYTGTFSADCTSVTGTYVCGNESSQTWSATIAGQTTIGGPNCSFGTTWTEQESYCTATWTLKSSATSESSTFTVQEMCPDGPSAPATLDVTLESGNNTCCTTLSLALPGSMPGGTGLCLPPSDPIWGACPVACKTDSDCAGQVTGGICCNGSCNKTCAVACTSSSACSESGNGDVCCGTGALASPFWPSSTSSD